VVENERPPDIFGRCMKHDANRVNLQSMRARARARSEKLNFLAAIASPKIRGRATGAWKIVPWEGRGRDALRGAGNVSRHSHRGRGATVRPGAADLLFGR